MVSEFPTLDPVSILLPYRTIVHKPDEAVDYYEAYKNIGRKYTRVTQGNLAQAVLKAAFDLGGKTFIRDNTYPISTTLIHEIAQGVVEGESWNAKLKLADGANCLLFRAEQTDIKVRNLCLDGNMANQTTDSAEGFKAQAKRVVIEFCELLAHRTHAINFISYDGVARFNYIHDSGIASKGHAIRCAGIKDHAIGNYILNQTYKGIYLYKSTLGYAFHEALFNWVENCQQMSISTFGNSQKCKIQNNTLLDSEYDHINIGSDYNDIIANVIRNKGTGVGDNGIILNGSYNSVKKNSCEFAGVSGVYVDENSHDNDIVGNKCFNNAKTADHAGIALYKAYSNLVEDNKCFDVQGSPTQNDGIRVFGAGAINNIIRGNDVRGNINAQGIDLQVLQNIVEHNEGFDDDYQVQTGAWANPSGALFDGRKVVVYNSTQAGYRLYTYQNSLWRKVDLVAP